MTSLHVAVQVKTGESHGSMDETGHWKPVSLDPRHFRDWQRGTAPTMLIWFRPRPLGDGRAYWALVPREGELRYFKNNSANAWICPVTPFDLSLRLERCHWLAQADREVVLKTFYPGLAMPIRKAAKAYYRRLMRSQVSNPLVADVRFTWRGWRHITADPSGRHVDSSLRLLAAAPLVVQKPGRFDTLRRLPQTILGNWVFNSRLIIFKPRVVRFADRAAANIVLVLRERVVYPQTGTIGSGDRATFVELSRSSPSLNESSDRGPFVRPPARQSPRRHGVTSAPGDKKKGRDQGQV